jgi:hypothetical protein
MMTTLRAIAVAIAVVAMVDPVFTVRRAAPLHVDVRPGSRGSTVDAVNTIKQRLESDLKGDVAVNSDAAADAVVLVGDRVDPEVVSAGLPVSTVSTSPRRATEIRISRSIDPDSVLPGWSATIGAEIEARGVAGQTSAITLEHNGIEVQRIEHRWTNDDERFPVKLAFTPPAAGFWPMKLRVRTAASDSRSIEDETDVRVVAEARTLRVAAWDARPSWTSAFVRRALEADPTFEVSTIVRASRDLEVRAGQAPPTLSAPALERFDVVLVGAPEELTQNEVLAVEMFARVRGGAVVFLPDRRPTGRYVDLLTAGGFDEVLVERAVELEVGGPRLRASELAVPRKIVAGTSPLATMQHDGGSRAVIFSSPLGAGRVLFSGALDAWRFRSVDDDAFANFWRSQVAIAAASAPRRLEISVQPAVVAPGTPVELRVTARRTELAGDPTRTVVPAVSAEVIGENGALEPVRLWPSPEIGVYEGTFVTSTIGRYDVRAHLGDITADTTVAVSSTASHRRSDDDSLRLVAQATGGVPVNVGDLRPLEEHLAGLRRPQVETNLHPMRSAWWAVLFVALLISEWGIRRRTGRR